MRRWLDFLRLRRVLKPSRKSWPQDSAVYPPALEENPSLQDISNPEQYHVPYDESLLERAQTQWASGDWESLTRIDCDGLERHPDRARLALWVAGAHQQTGNDTEARQFTRRAQGWGADAKLVRRILLDGVQRTIGRASAIGQQPPSAARMVENARDAEEAATRAADNARVGAQPQTFAIPSPATPEQYLEVAIANRALLTTLSKTIETLTDTLGRQKTELDAQLKTQAKELASLHKWLSVNMKTEVANAARQIGDFISLQNYFNSGKLSNIQLQINSWPVSSDFMLCLVKLINLNDYDLIIEFGSGASTLTIAKTLINMAPRRQGKAPVDFVSFDHLKQYYQQTLAQIKYAGLDDVVQLHLAPLSDYAAPNGNYYPYYSCQTVLMRLAQKHANKQLRLLITIDGPPGKTGKHARYPAGPLILESFKGASIDLLLDDAARADEKEIIALWQADYTAAGFRTTEQFIELEKGACLIQVDGNQMN